MRYRCIAISVFICLAILTATGKALRSDDPNAELAEADRLAWLKNWTKAEPHFAEAERGFEAQGNHRQALYARIGRLRGEMRSTPPQVISDAVAIAMNDPVVEHDLELKMRCLTVKGDADLDGDVSLALRDWTEALSTAQELKNPDWEWRAKGELGIIAFLHGDPASAMLQVGLALRHAVAAHDMGAEIRYRTLAGNGMSELGQGEESLKQFDKAITLAANNPDLGVPVMAMTGKATALVKLNRQAEARELLNKILAVARHDGNRGYQAQLLTQLGLLESQSGNKERAIAALAESAKLAVETGGFRLAADADCELAKLYEMSGKSAETQSALVEGIAASRRAGDRYFLPKYLGQYAEYNASRGRYAKADALFDEATDIVNGMLVRTSGPNSEGHLVAAMNELYLSHFRFEVERGRIDAAFAVLEQIRGRSMADLLRRSDDSGSKSAKLTPQEQKLSALQLQLWKPQSRTERRKLLERIFDTSEDFVPSQLPSTRYRGMRFADPLSAAAVRSRLRTDEALIEYLLTPKTSYAFVLTKEHIVLRRLAGMAEIEAAVDAHLKTIASRGKENSTGLQAFRLLIAPILPDLSSKTNLIISPDGGLHRLPFATLSNESGSLLLDQAVVTYTPSANVLALLRKPGSGSRPSRPLLAVSSSPESPKPRGPELASLSSPESGKTRGVFDADELVLRPLPAANDEVQVVANALGTRSIVLKGATETQFKQEDLADFRVIHLALHGMVSTKMPDLSALIFRPDSAGKDDGFLQSKEIAQLHLRADLVTLSACETGTGKINGEEGVENLIRPFLLAGAKGVVANLWDVDDEFSRGLMKRFYAYLSTGEDEGTALTKAQRAMIHDYGDQANAQLWSGFILVGDGAARVFSAKDRISD